MSPTPRRKQNPSTSLATTRFIAGCSLLTISSKKCAAFDAVRRCGSPSLFTITSSSAFSFSGLDRSSSYAALTLFSLSTGSGSRDNASSAFTKREYARFTRSSTCQYMRRLRSFGASAARVSGCSLKYFSFLSGGKSASRKSSCNAATACTAPRFPPLTRAFSSSDSSDSNDFKFATGSSCARTVAAAILSAAVPDARTALSHLVSAEFPRACSLSYAAVRSSSAPRATRSFSSISRCDGSFARFATAGGSASVSLASYHTLLSRASEPPPPPPPPPSFSSPDRFFSSLSGRGPAPGFHSRPRRGGRSPGRNDFFSSACFFCLFFPPAPPRTSGIAPGGLTDDERRSADSRHRTGQRLLWRRWRASGRASLTENIGELFLLCPSLRRRRSIVDQLDARASIRRDVGTQDPRRRGAGRGRAHGRRARAVHLDAPRRVRVRDLGVGGCGSIDDVIFFLFLAPAFDDGC